MFMFPTNSPGYVGNWEAAYHSLLNQYRQLQHDYQAAVDLGHRLQVKVDALIIEN